MSLLGKAQTACGLPERIHSDKGMSFAGTGIGRLSRVSVEWMR